MLSKEELSRYNRHLLLPQFGVKGQEKLQCAKVLVIGAGGLGCPVLLYLTAAGVGEIGIIDHDRVDVSNLQRQILYSEKDIGKLKAEIAAQKLSGQNPFVKFNVHPFQIDTANALDLVKNYDVIIDGTDNFATRYMVNDACVLSGKPLVYGSIYKFEGQVSVFNYTNAEGIKGPTYRCIFPTPPLPGSVLNCAEAGVLGVLPGIIGTLQATEAIKIIAGIGEPLSGKLLLIDALAMNFTTLEIKRNEDWKKNAPASTEEFRKTDYDFFCGSKTGDREIKKITAKELHELLLKKNDIQLLDVREPDEEPFIEELAELNIPLSKISSNTHLVSREKKVIVFCRSGTRSKRAIELLEKDFGFSNLYNLEGGVIEWALAQNKLK